MNKLNIKEYIKTWNFIRILRLALGISIIMQGLAVSSWLYVGAGIIFSMMPILNIGCCATSGCNTNMQPNKSNTEDITYEEVR